MHHSKLVALFVMAALTGGAGEYRAWALTAPDPAPPRVQVHTEQAADGRGVAVRFSTVVTAPAASVVQALDDVPNLPLWLPRMKSTARVESPGEVAGDAQRFESVMGLPWPVGEVRETIAVRREVDGEVVRLRWDHVEGDMRRNEVVWTVRALDAEHTEVHYDGNLWFKGWVPVFLIRLAERGYAPWFVDCLERRAAGLATAAAPPQNAAANDAAPRL